MLCRPLPHTPRPIARLSALMSDGENEEAITGDLVDDTVRKAADGYRPYVSEVLPPEIWVCAEEGDEAFDFVDEVAAQLVGLAFIKDGRVGEFRVGKRVETRRHPAMRRRASAKAVAVGTG